MQGAKILRLIAKIYVPAKVSDMFFQVRTHRSDINVNKYFFVMTVWQNNTECLSLGNLMLVGLELTNTVCRSPFSQSLEKDKPWTSGQTLKLISYLYLWRRKIFKNRHLQNVTEVDQHMRCPFRPAGDVQAGCNHMGVLPASKNEQRKVVGSGFTHRH